MIIISFNVQLEKLILVEQSLEEKAYYKERKITSQTDRCLVILSAKAYVFEGKLTKY